MACVTSSQGKHMLHARMFGVLEGQAADDGDPSQEDMQPWAASPNLSWTTTEVSSAALRALHISCRASC
eukprot:364811-Chlamydomonas_euryale.AAC.7